MKHNGFSLVELLIALSLVGLLVSFALPSYQKSVQKSRRSDAITTLLTIQLEQEKWRANHTTYATLADLGISNVSKEGYYLVGLTANSATGYVLTATATNEQLNDSGCTTITLTVNGSSETTVPSACW